jgi:hypothetical protein
LEGKSKEMTRETIKATGWETLVTLSLAVLIILFQKIPGSAGILACGLPAMAG